ncbi:MAG TPA: phosphotransferase [Terracidiphilus sp.]|nr:phosphotransferase [Terracidiphilus sp.]
MIPQEKIAAVTRGLRAAFGVDKMEEMQMLSGGHRADLIFRIAVRGTPYLLRIVKRVSDPTNHFAAMQAAAEALLAPRVWYANAEEGVCIMDFIEAVPLPRREALAQMPAAMRALHALPAFPARANHLNTSCTFLLNSGAAVDELLRSFREADLVPRGEKEQFFAWHAELGAVCRQNDAEMAPCHNDLVKPDNILFDGNRVWLVDWEAAFQNDRYADLAVVANFVVTHEAEERSYLARYFGQLPDEYQLARFFLMRQVAHMFYAMAYLLLGSAGKAVDWNDSVPEFGEFHRRIWAGEVDFKDSSMKIAYGQVHWRQLMRNLELARFGEAMRTVGERHASG